MYRRSLIARLNAAVLAIAFLASGADDAFALHPCAHHDGAPAAHVEDASQSDGVAAEREQVVDDVHSHDAVGESSPEPSHHEDEPCSCMGQCSTPPAVGAPRLGIETARPMDVLFEATERFDDGSPRAALTPYVLPFANAPPATLLIPIHPDD